MKPQLMGEEGRLWRYALVVLLPTVLVLLYSALIASDGYVSHAQVRVEREASVPVPDFAAGLLSMAGGGPSRADALVVRTFMESRAMLEYLDEALDLRGHFSAPDVDVWSRLSPRASAEDFLKFYRRRLTVSVDEESHILDLQFVAHDRAFARQVTERLVARSEEFVNEVSHYLAREQLAFVQQEVSRAHEKLRQASREMVELQQRYEVFSPERETEAAGTILAGLLAELAEQRTTMKALSSYLNPNAAEVVATRQRIEALESQIAQERAAMVGTRDADREGLNQLMLSYRDAEVNLQLAGEIYKTAIGTLESTRLETARKVKYLVSLSPPSLPDAAEHPRVGYRTGTVFVLLNLVYFVIGLIIATIRDHRE